MLKLNMILDWIGFWMDVRIFPSIELAKWVDNNPTHIFSNSNHQKEGMKERTLGNMSNVHPSG
jgi:hypothetical protein